MGNISTFRKKQEKSWQSFVDIPLKNKQKQKLLIFVKGRGTYCSGYLPHFFKKSYRKKLSSYLNKKSHHGEHKRKN